MEISKLSDTSIKIKGKNGSVVIDPNSKTEAQIIIATQPLDSLSLDKVEGQRLIISGPGEYEAAGISVTGRDIKNGVIYQLTEGAKIIFSLSTTASSIPDDETFDCVVIKIVGEFKDDVLGPLDAKCVVLYGDTALATIMAENQEKTNKVNLKKLAEVQGKTFILE